MARVVFCGAQNTGKTSVAVEIDRRTDLKLVSGFARSSPYAGVFLNKDSHSLNQIYLTAAIANATSVDNTISDRCPIDSHAYTVWSYANGSMHEDDYIVYEEDQSWLDNFVEQTMKNYDLVVYFPAYNWPIESDGGIRSLDANYRQEIDSLMHEMLDDFAPGYITMPDVDLPKRLVIMESMLKPLGVEFK